MLPGPQADFEDLRFLDHINLKIRGDGGGAAPQASSVNPKALNAPLGEEVFVRLLGAFEFFLQRPQVCTWSPHLPPYFMIELACSSCYNWEEHPLGSSLSFCTDRHIALAWLSKG